MRRLFLALALLAGALPARAQDITVFAAASLTDALRDVAQLWESTGRPKLRFNFAASSALARQIDNGAPANMFASADLRWMDWAQSRNLIAADTRRSVLGNRLVLIMPRDQARTVKIGPDLDIQALLGADGRLATGDPASVPVGLYAKQALSKLNLWAVVEPRLARTEDVRAALLLVERGEARLGIVYSTDAIVAPNVAIAGTFPSETHDPIVYPFAVTKPGDTPQARALLEFIAGPQGAEVFRRRGFQIE